MTRKPVNNDDDALWVSVTRTVTPLGRRTHITETPAQSSRKRTTPARKTEAETTPPSRKTSPPQPADLDSTGYGGISRSNARKIKTGQVHPTAKIDLHGLTRNEARSKLERFLVKAAAEQHRLVLVVTGKGIAGQGVIRKDLPQWLTSPPLASMVIAYCQAQPKDGGGGAFYINLRQS
jgi:DNA-nicking Smr family endonuclease